jgi:FolB domain-containing protein
MSEILIDSLRVKTWIGVPDPERMAAQEIEIDIRIHPRRNFAEMNDDISLTVDYAAVCQRVSELARERPRRLIESLAQSITEMILNEFQATSVEVEIRKFILPETRYVGVRTCHGNSDPFSVSQELFGHVGNLQTNCCTTHSL